MKLSVIGLGKLGLCTAVCLARGGYDVVGVDNDDVYMEKLKAEGPQFHESGLETLFRDVSDNLTITSDIRGVVKESDVSFIIVPTPSTPNGSFSNDFLCRVLDDMAPALKEKNTWHLVNIVSTVSPGTCQRQLLPLLEGKTGKKVGADIGLAYNPEFIAIGSVIRDFLNPDLVLIGESDERSGAVLQEIYKTVCDNSPYFARTSLISAEIAKLSINCYCTMKISFANSLRDVCDTLDGADAGRICEIVGKDSRIGGKYIKPGLGFGGPCFPRDNEAFIHFMKKSGVSPSLQESVVGINNRQVENAVAKIVRAAREYGNRIALLGLSYKPDTYLCERSQAFDIAHCLTTEYPEFEVRVYDPMAVSRGAWKTSERLEDCVTGAQVAVVLTPWRMFQEMDWRLLLADRHCILDFWK